jgi:hypothetical protein
MQEQSKITIYDIERNIAVVAIQLHQQERIIEELQEGAGRLEALSVFADLLRSQYELEINRHGLRKRFSAYALPGPVLSAEDPKFGE